MGNVDSFKATAFYVWKQNHSYRIYPKGARVYFIRCLAARPNRSSNASAAVVSQFGLIGGLAVWLCTKLAARNRELPVPDDDPTAPEQLLAKNPENFVLDAAQILEPRIEAPAKPLSYGPHKARWHFTKPGGEEAVMLFNDVAEVQAAIALLRPVLGAKLRVNARWDEQSRRFHAVA